jgi:oxygen-independent coproporphyrinogen-3 oxidase
MAGVYIHIPFCKNRCTYCDFHFSTTFESYRKRMIDAICTEIELRLSDHKHFDLKTLYFGGGTPSLLHQDDWEKIIEQCSRFIRVSRLAEFTIEANPDDVTEANLKLWRRLGVNRLSIGVQSFRNQDLEWMNRAHDAEDSLRSINLARQFGFDNISIDLMYGLPNQSKEDWLEQLDIIAVLDIPHVSAYCLTLEERTTLKKRVSMGELVLPDDELIEEQFSSMQAKLASFGLEQYEISNFAKPGKEAIHNSNYWRGVNYIGIGPSAHGFDGFKRYWNVANNIKYINSLIEKQLPQEEELLAPKDHFNELVMTGLRTKWGVDLNKLKKIIELEDAYYERIKQFQEEGVLQVIDDRMILNHASRIKADYYASKLFID